MVYELHLKMIVYKNFSNYVTVTIWNHKSIFKVHFMPRVMEKREPES